MRRHCPGGLDDRGIADRYGIQTWAWGEACRMFLRTEVWGATTELANRLRGSKAIFARVSGPVIEKTVARHCPEGWEWSAAPVKVSMPVTMERRA